MPILGTLKPLRSLIRSKKKKILALAPALSDSSFLLVCVMGGLVLAWRWGVERWKEMGLLGKEVEWRRRARIERDKVKDLPKVRPRKLTLTVGERRGWSDDVVSSSAVSAGCKDGAKMSPKPGTRKRRRMKQMRKNGRGNTEQKTIDQLGKSDFWRLPFEVRERIWLYATGGHHIHIVRRRGRLGNVYCSAEEPTDPLRRDLCLETRDEHGFYTPTAWPMDHKPMGLLLSCRQVYSECIDFLYMHNTIAFDEAAIMHSFLTNLLPYRRNLIAHIHLAPYFGTDDKVVRLGNRVIATTYTPPMHETRLWVPYVSTLKTIPHLRSLSVTPGADRLTPGFTGSQPLIDIIRTILEELSQIRVDGPFTVAWPNVEWTPSTPRSYWGHNDNLPSPRTFDLRHIPPRSAVQLFAFFLPFHVQCLHCTTYTLIRKATRGFAEMCYFYRDPVTEDLVLVPPWPEHSLFSDPKPSLRRYWTFHALCRGWIEFIYDHENNEWSVAHGAREVGDEEVAMHGHGEAPSAHELLRGLFVDFMREGSSPRGYSTATEWEDWADLPTRDTFYRNAGWLCE